MLDASTVYQYELIKTKELADRLMVDRRPLLSSESSRRNRPFKQLERSWNHEMDKSVVAVATKLY